jgi:hypothetical protein
MRAFAPAVTDPRSVVHPVDDDVDPFTLPVVTSIVPAAVAC